MSLRRRELLAATGLLAAGCTTPPPEGFAPRAPGPLTPDEARWLNRLTWGVNDSAAAEMKALGRERWVHEQLQPAPWPPRLPAAVQARVLQLSISQVPVAELARRLEAQRKAVDDKPEGEARAAARQALQQETARLGREAATRQIWRSLYAPRQLQDQMGWFWLNHFNVHGQKANVRALVGDYDDRLHALALGRFRDLLGAVVFHPVMLRYLDNDQNAVRRINENLGRELLELHTLGVDGGYSQADVQELARVLTGLGVNLGDESPRKGNVKAGPPVRRGLAEFNPARHDFGPKTLLGQAVQGEGLAEIEGVLDRLARHPNTARHVCRKIAQFLMADKPHAAVVERMAATYTQRDGRVDEVLRTLFAQPEFVASLGQRFKDPQHFVLSAVRQAWGDTPIANPEPVLNWLQRLGQAPYGHTTPDGYPLDSMAWTGPGQLTTRFEVARTIGQGAPALFRTDEAGAAATAPPPPQLKGALFLEALLPQVSPASRQVLAQAANPREWNAYWLSSPEFMTR
jgi:uncharacterized protein (DUF1800 family)